MVACLDISSRVWGCGFRAWIIPNLVVKVILINSLVACMKSSKDAWNLWCCFDFDFGYEIVRFMVVCELLKV